jgi:hypothetical protein
MSLFKRFSFLKRPQNSLFGSFVTQSAALTQLLDTDLTVNTASVAGNNGDTAGVTILLQGTLEPVTYSIVSQSVTGAFQIDPVTGIVTIADITKLPTL